MNTTTNKKRLILILIGTAVFSALFVLIYMPLQTNLQKKQSELDALGAELLLLEDMEKNRHDFEQNTISAKKYIDEQINFYPADIKEEDVTTWLLSLESSTRSEIINVSFSPPTSVLQFKAFISGADSNYLADMNAYSKASSFSGTFSYSGIKNAIDIIYSSSDRTSIESLSLTYDATSSQIAATFNITKYFVNYPGAIYAPLAIEQAGSGLSNPFGTYEN